MKVNLAALKILLTIVILIPTINLKVYGQDDDSFEEKEQQPIRSKTFSTGLYIGSYFPNKYTASLYDGYGFDFDGNRNIFENSWMYQKIINQYGGGFGQPDIISEELGVPPEDWSFTESDMPVNMRYKTSIAVGFAGRYSVDAKNAVVLNATAAIVTAAGNFTITTRPPSGSTQINNSIRTFEIRGKEQRLLMQAGYQRLLGEGESFNAFIEGGLHATLAKFDESEIQINDLRINLYESYYDPNGGYSFFTGSKPVGLGFGAFTGIGVNIRTTGKWMLQLLYNAQLENVRIGYNPKIKISQSAGLRAYYLLSKNN
ncbi:MAG: hypothetical protein IPL22_10245 [Bacteroidetes bacterium]|nr:hypothetical protein [Bacteroidota bacterium]